MCGLADNDGRSTADSDSDGDGGAVHGGGGGVLFEIPVSREASLLQTPPARSGATAGLLSEKRVS